MSEVSDKLVPYAIFLIISFAYIVAAAFRIQHVPLWMDEVLAVVAAQQSGFAGVYRAIWAGTDFSPPTFHFLLHALPGFSQNPLVVSRLPSAIASLCAAWCVYLIARRRFDAPVALVAFGVTLASPLFDYAVQARQYALTTCLLAAALALWDDLPARAGRRPLWLLGIWAALAGCVSLHFYGIVAVGAVAWCEVLWSVFNRTVRWPVWGALTGVGPVFLAWLPLAVHLHKFSAADQLASAFYGHPTLAGLYHAIVDLAVGGQAQMVIYGGVVFAIVVSTCWPSLRDEEAKCPVAGLDSNLVILMLGLCAIPLGAYVLAVGATGSFVPRYALGVTLLPGLAIAGVLFVTPRPALAALLVVPFVEVALLSQATEHDRTPTILAALEMVHEAPRGAPVFVGDGLLYIEMVGALPTAERAHLAYIAKPGDQAAPDPTNENEVLRLASFDNRFRSKSYDEAMNSASGIYMLKTTPNAMNIALFSAVSRHVPLRLVADNGPALLYFVPPKSSVK